MTKQLITGEELQRIRDNKIARAQITKLVDRSASETALAFGEVGRHGPSFAGVEPVSNAAKEAVHQLLMAQATQNILMRLEDVLDKKSQKPLSKQAVGWAVKRIAEPENRTLKITDFAVEAEIDKLVRRATTPGKPSEFQAAMDAIGLTQLSYQLSPELETRLIEEMMQEGIVQKGREVGGVTG